MAQSVAYKGRRTKGKAGRVIQPSTSGGGGGIPSGGLAGLAITGIVQGSTLEVANDVANGIIVATAGLTNSQGTITGTGTWTLAVAGLSHIVLSANTGNSVNLLTSGIVSGDVATYPTTLSYTEGTSTATVSFSIDVYDNSGLVQLQTFKIINPSTSAIVQPWITETGFVFSSSQVVSTNKLVIKDSGGNTVTAGWSRSTYPNGQTYRASPKFKATETIGASSNVTYTLYRQAGAFDTSTGLGINNIPNGITVTALVAGSVQSADNGTWTASTTTAKTGRDYSATTGYGTVAGDGPTRGRQLISSSPTHNEWHLWQCMENALGQAHYWLRVDFFVLVLSDGTCEIDAVISHPYFNGAHPNGAAGSSALISGAVRPYGYNSLTMPSGNLTVTMKDSAGTTFVTATQLCLAQNRGLMIADSKGHGMVVNSSGVLQTHHRAFFYNAFANMVNTTIPPYWSSTGARTAFAAALTAYTAATPYVMGTTVGDELHGDNQGLPYQSGEIEAFMNDTSGYICLTLGDQEKYQDSNRIKGVAAWYNHDIHINPATGCLLDYTTANSFSHAASRVGNHSSERRDQWLLPQRDSSSGRYIMMTPWDIYLTPGGDTHQNHSFFYPFISSGRMVFLYGQAVMSTTNNTLLFRIPFTVGGTNYYFPKYLFAGPGGVRVGLWPFFDAWHLANLCPPALHWRGPAEWTATQTLNGLAAMVTQTLTAIDGETSAAVALHRCIGHNLTNVPGAWFGGFLWATGDAAPFYGVSMFDMKYPVDVWGRVANSGAIGSAQAITLINGWLKNFHNAYVIATNNLYVAETGRVMLFNSDAYTMRFTDYDNLVTNQIFSDPNDGVTYHAGATRLCGHNAQGLEGGASNGAQAWLAGFTELMILGTFTRAQWDAKVAAYGTTGGSAGISVLKTSFGNTEGGVAVYCRQAYLPADLNT